MTSAQAVMPDPMAPEPVRVVRVAWETRDTVTIDFEHPNRAAGLPFLPGQFNMLYAFGVGEVPISISGDPADPRKLVHTIRVVGTVTDVIRRARKGTVLGLRGPFGEPWPMEEARGKDVLLVAGGLGLAPLRPAIYHLFHHRKDYGEVAILIGARTPEDLLFREEVRSWQARGDVQVLVTVDRAGPEWTGPVGVVPALIEQARFRPEQTLAMLCGPEAMMRFTVRELERQKIGPTQTYLSMERSMKCAVGLCGHCQFGPTFVCKDGPVFRYDRVEHFFVVREA